MDSKKESKGWRLPNSESKDENQSVKKSRGRRYQLGKWSPSRRSFSTSAKRVDNKISIVNETFTTSNCEKAWHHVEIKEQEITTNVSEIPLPQSSEISSKKDPPKKSRKNDLISTEPSTSNFSSAVSGNSSRKWLDTGLGAELSSGARVTQPRDFIFTIMSYNVLSDKLMKLHPELYNGKTEEELQWETRWIKLLHEIQSFDVDIFCLQEVDCEHYESCFVPAFSKQGYRSIYKQKTDDKNDGCAIFYKKKKVELVDWTSVEYYQPNTVSLDRHNVALIAKFRPKSYNKKSMDCGSTFCVATTHLLFNPRRHDVKLAQVALMLAELDRMCYIGLAPGTGIPHYHPCIVTGDFNLTPNSPVYNFMETGFIAYGGLSNLLQTYGTGSPLSNFLFPPELGVTDNCQHLDVASDRIGSSTSPHPTRLFHTQYRTDNERALRPIPFKFRSLFGSGTLTHAFRFRSAYKHQGGCEAVSSNTPNGYGTVDYIFYSTVPAPKLQRWVEGNLKLLSRLQLLSGTQIHKLGGLPSLAFPSDHICLVAKFLLRGGRKYCNF